MSNLQEFIEHNHNIVDKYNQKLHFIKWLTGPKPNFLIKFYKYTDNIYGLYTSLFYTDVNFTRINYNDLRYYFTYRHNLYRITYLKNKIPTSFFIKSSIICLDNLNPMSSLVAYISTINDENFIIVKAEYYKDFKNIINQLLKVNNINGVIILNGLNYELIENISLIKHPLNESFYDINLYNIYNSIFSDDLHKEKELIRNTITKYINDQ